MMDCIWSVMVYIWSMCGGRRNMKATLLEKKRIKKTLPKEDGRETLCRLYRMQRKRLEDLAAQALAEGKTLCEPTLLRESESLDELVLRLMALGIGSEELVRE